MPHLSLYRKYRPQTFSEVVGQSHVTQTLANAIVEDRIAHAYLFSGPRGTGKTSTARILAKSLNCEKGPTPEPDNSCTACIEITEGTSLDVVEIDAASHGSVEDARELREKVAYSPVGGRRKIYIIDECHMLSAAANNALLKVLEEPPPHVVFVFATTEPHKVLQTLLDRCQRYEFRQLDTEAISGLVEQVCEAEEIAIDEEAVSLIGSRAAGSARDALSLLDQLHSFAGPKVTISDVTQLLGSVPEDLLTEVVDLISERDAGTVLTFSDRLIRSGRDVREFTRALVEHLRSLFLVLHAPAAQEILDVSDDRLGTLTTQANRFDHTELLRLIDLANEIQLQLRQAVEGRLALEIGLARMARPDLHATPPSMLSRIERLERLAGIEGETEATPAPARQPKPPVRSKSLSAKKAAVPAEPEVPAPVMEAGDLDIDKIRTAWDDVLQKVRKRKISFHAVLLQASPAGWNNGQLLLEFSSKHGWHRDQVSDPVKQGPLVEAFFETFGVRPVVQCALGQGVEAEATITEIKHPEKDPVDLIREGFEAEVVEEDDT